MKIETLNKYDEIPEDCPKCNNELSEIYQRSKSETDLDEDFDLVVINCSVCNSIYAYYVDTSGIEHWGGYLVDDEPEYTENQPLNEKRRKSPFSKECAEAYTKAIVAMDAKNREMDRLIQSKLPELSKAGLSLATVNFARNKVANRLTSKRLSPKSLTKLVAAAIYVTANSVTPHGSSLWKHQGEGITEEKTEEIFGVTRKTIRKMEKVVRDPFLEYLPSSITTSEITFLRA